MKKRILMLALLSCWICLGFAQDSEINPLSSRKNAGVLQLGGPTLIYSVGYERALFAKKRHALVVHAGGMVGDDIAGFHAGLSYLFFIKRSALEAGISYVHINDASKGGWIDFTMRAASPHVGYRYYFKKDKVFLKGGVNLLIGQGETIPWPYLGVGFRF